MSTLLKRKKYQHPTFSMHWDLRKKEAMWVKTNLVTFTHLHISHFTTFQWHLQNHCNLVVTKSNLVNPKNRSYEIRCFRVALVKKEILENIELD